MTNLASKLALAAALAAAAPTLAHAAPCDAVHRAAPAVGVQYGVADPYAGAGRHDERRGWRHEQRERLHVELARLDHRRADFYATRHRRGEVRRFERWYAQERSELLGRLAELDRAYAYR